MTGAAAATNVGELSRLFDFSPSAVFLIDCDGTVRYANRAFCASAGLSAGELADTNISTLGQNPDSPIWVSIRTKRPWQGMLSLEIAGREHCGPASVTPILDSAGECTSALCVCHGLHEISEESVPMTPATPLVLVVDLDGTIFFIDRTVPGISRDETIGSSIYNYMPAEHHDRIRTYLATVVEERSSLSYEVPSVGPYGTVLTYQVHVGPIERDGQVVALSFVSWEATPHPSDLEKRNRMLAQAGMEGLIIHDGTTIVDANEAVCEMFGYRADELAGKAITKLFVGRGRSAVNRAAFYNTGALQELTARRADGTLFQVEVCGKRLPHQSGLSTVIAVRDVSSRHQRRPPARRYNKPAEAMTSGRRSKAIDLSDREMDVLELLAQGLTNREVSRRIQVSARTVDHHVSHILAKLGVANRTAAAMAARSKGLLRKKK